MNVDVINSVTMDLSIIVVNYNVYQDVIKCIESIYKFLNKKSFEILVVDNNSSDRSILNINSIYKDVKLISLKENKGFGAANNVAMRIANGNFFLLVNPGFAIQTANAVQNKPVTS